MSLTGVMSIATSGMRAAQSGLRTVSDNISNVNTPGYARKLVQQESLVLQGAGAGVAVSGVRRATDLYLQKASLDAASEVGRSGVIAEILDRAQALFGDPSKDTAFLNRLAPIAKAFATASEDSTSDLLRSGATFAVDRFFDEAAEIGAGLRELGRQVEVRIGSVVDRVNGLLEDINALNVEISRSVVTGRDASGAENVQAQLIDQLSSLIDIRRSPRANGGTALTATDGTPLTGDSRGRFEYFSQNGDPGLVRVVFEYGQSTSLIEGLGGGELRGLMTLRDSVLPALGEQLGEFTTRSADALNRAHNAATTTPAPTRLIGRNLGVPLDRAIDGFRGRTAVLMTSPDGMVTKRVDIDFNARTMSSDGGAPTAWTPGDFGAQLNAAMAPMGSAGYGPPMELAASGTGRISVIDDPTAPSEKAGRGFSHYFGLNDLVVSNTPAFYDNGLTASDPHGFTPGGEITFRFDNGTGARFADARVTIPATGGGTLGELLTLLNDPQGAGKVGSFTLDAGVLRFTSKVTPAVTLGVLSDTTMNPTATFSMSEVHGLGVQRSMRAQSFRLHSAVAGEPQKLALGVVDFTAQVGQRALSNGDGRGAFLLAQASEVGIRFERAGEVTETTATLSSYAAQLGGAIGRRAQSAQERLEGAEAIAHEANARRSSVEGVNLDEELIQLTVYQQAYNASARLITAAKEMYDVLLSLP